MATLLLVVIYLSFISLGVPDSLLGTAWPVLYRELGVPLASQSDLQHEQRPHHLPPRHGQSDRVLNAFDRRCPARLLLFGQLLVHVPDGDSAWAGRGLR